MAMGDSPSLTPLDLKVKAKKQPMDSWWWLVIATFVLIVILVLASPDPYRRALVFFQDGIWVTIYITVTSFVLVLVVGLIGGLGRLSKAPLIRGLASIYVEVLRGIPMMVQLIFWYFAFPSLLQKMGAAFQITSLTRWVPNPVSMAIFGLTLGYGAYMSEVIRAGIQSIPRGQMEAARSLGMTYLQAMRYIILPQAVRVILPPVGNEFITLLKDSSLVSVVAVSDLTRRGREFMTLSGLPLETWTMVALVYLLLTLLATRAVAWIEKASKIEK